MPTKKSEKKNREEFYKSLYERERRKNKILLSVPHNFSSVSEMRYYYNKLFLAEFSK